MDRPTGGLNEITEGKYVFHVSHEAFGGTIGVVISEDGDQKTCHVKSGLTKQVHVEQLNLCNFQQGTYVNMASNERGADHVGIVTGHEGDEGKLTVVLQGSQRLSDGRDLIRCEFQRGTWVCLLRSDEEVPMDQIGVVAELGGSGRLKVRVSQLWGALEEILGM